MLLGQLGMFNFSFNLSTKIFLLQSCNKYILTIFGTITSIKNTANILAFKFFFSQFSSVTQSCPTLYHHMDCSTIDFAVDHQLPELALTRPLSQWCLPAICCHLLLPPSIFPSIRVFSSESFLLIRWPKYWSFSFTSILPMNI